MAFITLGTASQLQIKVPTIGTTDWADTMRTDTFLKIAQHAHTGSGDGAQLGTGSIQADAITGAKIRLDNDEFLKARNAADSANINMIKVGTTNHLELGAPFKNNTYITARNQADSADINVWKIDATDDIDFGAEIGNITLKQDTFFDGRNAADSADVNLFKIDANDDFLIDPDISKLNLKNSTYLTGRNNADSANINLLRVNTSDKLEISPEISAVVKLSNNVALQHRNNADSAYISTISVNTSDLIVLGAEVVDVQTNTVKAGATAVTLTDNQSSATSAGVITLSTDESCAIHYRLVRNGTTQSGVLRFTDVETVPSESFTGTDVGVTFSVNAGALEYTSTSTGQNISMTYVVVKE